MICWPLSFDDRPRPAFGEEAVQPPVQIPGSGRRRVHEMAERVFGRHMGR